MSSTVFEKYILTSFMYGGIRKLFYTYDTQYKQKIDNKVIERPILYSHRVVHFIFAGIMSIGLSPMHLFNDISRLEMYMRKITPFPNNYPTTYYNWNNDDKDFYTVLWDEHKCD